MKVSKSTKVPTQSGFTLVEVLIALAIAAIGFGVILHSIGLQMSLVATSVERHQMLLHASQALETSLSRGTSGDEEVEAPIGSSERDQEDGEVQRFFYSLSAKPVTADPRIQEVTVTVKGSRGQTRLAAYRVRVRREQ